MVLTTILLAAAVLISVPAICFLLASFSPTRAQGPVGGEDAEMRRLLFLVSAHNEEVLIAECVRSLVGVDYPADRRLVVVIANQGVFP